MFRSKLFGAHINPACAYCEHGRVGADERMILCKHKGIVSPYYKCRKFLYAPLKRVPRRQPKLPNFTPEDFKL